MTVISSPDNINRGQCFAVNKKDILGFVYVNAKNLGFSIIKVFQRTFSQISLFSDHYFNHFNNCYHYHYQCHDFHHSYHYYNHSYRYNDYPQFYHHCHDYHCQHYYR